MKPPKHTLTKVKSKKRTDTVGHVLRNLRIRMPGHGQITCILELNGAGQLWAIFTHDGKRVAAGNLEHLKAH